MPIATFDAMRSVVFLLKSRFCNWRALIGQHFCVTSSQKSDGTGVRSAHVFDLKLLKEFYSVFGIYCKIHSFREIFIG